MTMNRVPSDAISSASPVIDSTSAQTAGGLPAGRAARLPQRRRRLLGGRAAGDARQRAPPRALPGGSQSGGR